MPLEKQRHLFFYLKAASHRIILNYFYIHKDIFTVGYLGIILVSLMKFLDSKDFYGCPVAISKTEEGFVVRIVWENSMSFTTNVSLDLEKAVEDAKTVAARWHACQYGKLPGMERFITSCDTNLP